jgi:hypothetical protein
MPSMSSSIGIVRSLVLHLIERWCFDIEATWKGDGWQSSRFRISGYRPVDECLFKDFADNETLGGCGRVFESSCLMCFRDGCQTACDRCGRQARDDARGYVEANGFGGGWKGREPVCGAPGFEDPEIGLVSFAGRWGFGCTDEVVGFLDEVFEAVRKVRRGDEFVLHKRNSEVRQVNME